MDGEFRLGPWLVQPSLNIICKHGTKVHLEPKVMEVLVCLARRAGEAVPRAHLLESVWPGTFVTHDALKRCVFELRRAFNDDARNPDIIETIPKRGYRLIAAVERVGEKPVALAAGFSQHAAAMPATRHSVGREKEHCELRVSFESAAAGRGLLLCVTGEAGIGKTTLVEDFLSRLRMSGTLFSVVKGRCSQRLAGSEAYLPFLESLDGLLRNDGGGIAQKLRTLAPSWYAQLVPLLEADPSDAKLQEYVSSTTQERVKRELAAFLSDFARIDPLVLFFDDLHWADPSTVDLIAHLATKLDSLRILVIVTYRPSEMFLLKHPFIGVKRDFQARATCREIEVQFLSEKDVEGYVNLQYPKNSFPPEFRSVIHSRTEGNPLFMVDLLRYLRERHIIVKSETDPAWRLAQSLPSLSRVLPESARSMIETKIDQLSDRDREVLTAAAVQGYEFDSAALARALNAENMEIEERLERLDRINGLIKRVAEDEFPDGTVTVLCRFVHVLYQNALDSSLMPARRAALSGALARALQAFYTDRVSAIAAQLGFLFESAQDPGRAADYFLVAARNAQRIFANQEAIALAQRGLALLSKAPQAPERTRKELDLQFTLAFAFLCTVGYAAPETGTNMVRARELCRAMGDTALLSPILFGLWAYYLGKGELTSARETAENLLSTANNATMLVGAHGAMGMTLHHQGELVSCRQHFEAAAKVYDVAQHSHYVQLYSLDPEIHSESEMIRTLWMLGFPEQARRKADETLKLARALSNPLSLAFCYCLVIFLYHFLDQPEEDRAIGAACIALCSEHGILLERAWISCTYGWAIAELGQVEEGLSYVHTCLDTQLAIGAVIARPQSLAVLAETLWHAGRTLEALKAVEDGLAVSCNGDKYYDAELWRLKGELLNLLGKTPESECCYRKAIEIAQQQAAKSLELRASTSLARLWQKQRKQAEAKQLLEKTYSWFTEGFDTADLKETASLLAELS